MIADLKADSESWDAERRRSILNSQSLIDISMRDSGEIVRKSNTPIVEYRSSITHQARQYYGPTEATPTPTSYATPYQQGSGAPMSEIFAPAQHSYYSQSTASSTWYPQQALPKDSAYQHPRDSFYGRASPYAASPAEYRTQDSVGYSASMTLPLRPSTLVSNTVDSGQKTKDKHE